MSEHGSIYLANRQLADRRYIFVIALLIWGHIANICGSDDNSPRNAKDQDVGHFALSYVHVIVVANSNRFKDLSSSCQPYRGMVCAGVLSNRRVYIPSFSYQNDHEEKLIGIGAIIFPYIMKENSSIILTLWGQRQRSDLAQCAVSTKAFIGKCHFRCIANFIRMGFSTSTTLTQSDYAVPFDAKRPARTVLALCRQLI